MGKGGQGGSDGRMRGNGRGGDGGRKRRVEMIRVGIEG